MIKSPLLRLMRPLQWIKNGFVLAPLFFSFQFLELQPLLLALIAALVFCLQSSACYILNDIRDVEEDRQHPTKKNRPVASGEVTPAQGVRLALLLAVAAYGLTLLFLPLSCLGVLAGYGAMQWLYTTRLKAFSIVDVLIIALGFVLRVLMGGIAIGVFLSPWIFLCTFVLTLFLGFGKRYAELVNLPHAAQRTRQSLTFYNPEMLRSLMTISCSVTIMSYALYSVELAAQTGKQAILGGGVFVVFGLFRYIFLVFVERKGGAPEQIMVRDKVLPLNALLWLAYSLWALA